MQTNRKMLFLVLALLLALVLSCTGQTPTSAPGAPVPSASQTSQSLALKTLQTNKILYDNTFKTAALLYSQGKLSEATKTKLIQLGNTYILAHNAATQALLNNQQVSLQTVNDALDAFLSAARAAGVK
jgi:hypothetical protein